MTSTTIYTCDSCGKVVEHEKMYRIDLEVMSTKHDNWYVDVDLCRKCYRDKKEAFDNFRSALSKYVPLK